MHARHQELLGALGLLSAIGLSGCQGLVSTQTNAISVGPLQIAEAPQSLTVVNGQLAQFRVVADGGTGHFSYQWRDGGVPIAGATSAVYITSRVDASASGKKLSVVVSDGSQSVTSTEASLTVLSDATISAPLEVQFNPSDTGVGIDDAFGTHVMEFNPSVTAKNKLFVFFPASLSKPTNDLQILRQAANNGFHVIGLAYPDQDVVAIVCGKGNTDPSCQQKVREETMSGNDVSPKVSVDQANSVLNRLEMALVYLNSQRPGEGWGQFLNLNSNEPRWDLIRLSGHSQGGGLAAYVAYKRAVDRVCTFSSPADYDDTLGQPADWLYTQSLTPAARYYGFGHTQDQIVPWANLQKIWGVMGMAAFGGPVSVDSTQPEYAASHMLSTASGDPAKGHLIPVVDSATPMDANGLPVFRPVWQSVCFH